MIKASCNNCRFATANEIDQNLQRSIVCKRYPPTSYPTQTGIMTIFPVVNHDMSCGEFKAETPVGLFV